MALHIAIRGAGVAGLSLASAIKSQGIDCALQLFDSRVDYQDDRTLSYFHVHEHLFSALAQPRFQNALIYTNVGAKKLALPYAYERIRAIDFYQDALRRTGLSLFDADAFNPSLFDVVFDSRPLLSTPTLWQIFFGGEFELVKPHGITSPILMDFRLGGTPWPRFAYLLPLSVSRVLLQDTHFVPANKRALITPYERGGNATLQSYLAEHFENAIRECVRKENGALPMGQQHVSTCRDGPTVVVPIGARAGWLRAATGYSFLETQRGVGSICNWLKTDMRAPPSLQTRPRFLDRMDRVLLRAIVRDTERNVELATPSQRPAAWFSALFNHARTDALIRFLAGTANAFDSAHIARVMAQHSCFRPTISDLLGS